ncbi:rhomboid family intramembrane serine protease [Plastorhodobacter daqingensis]|uniref:Rhomboid family intramembrane serine protease n=1 Tax=Plastorhodobacter daqingensis TaxID=1387281 RepID=A0ABW2UIM0_9RHOB
MTRDYAAPPFNPMPPVVWLLVLPLAVIELVLQAGAAGLLGGPDAVGWRLSAMRSFGFFDTIFNWMLANLRFPPEHLLRLVSYSFIHTGFVHALFTIVLTLALGKMVGEVWPGRVVALVWLAATVVGAVAYGLLLNDPAPLVGAYPPVFGLLGAFTFLLWVNLAARGANKFRAFTLIGMLLLFRLVLGLFFDAGNGWVAELAGFATGFGLSFVVSPGAWPRVLEQIRRR